ncbi:MAG: hypothetical protein N3G48_06230 [Sulfolobales archaeon]|nr:hypothetical protein [Sulfolobales archaeon]
MPVTGLKVLDSLVEPLMKFWGVEFYGDCSVTSYVLHHTLAFRSRYEDIHLIIAQEFGGIRTDVLTKLCRIYDCVLTKVRVVRVFSNSELREVLSGMVGLNAGLVVVAYPYNYLPKDPYRYFEATSVSGLLRRIMQENELLIFNNFTRFGNLMPEGGSLHHHMMKVVVMLRKHGSKVCATLLKHPAKPSGATKVFNAKLLEDLVLLARGKTLLEWSSTDVVG